MKRPRAGKVLSEYHVEYDILYLFAGELMASEAESIDEDHDVSIRYSMEDGRVAGAIIIDYSKKDATTLDSILPPVLRVFAGAARVHPVDLHVSVFRGVSVL